MAGISYSDLRTNIRNYTEVSSTVLTDAVIENFVLNAEYRIFRDVPSDAYRSSTTGNLVTNQDFVNVPAGALVIRGVQVYTSTSVTTGANTWLIKKDLTFLEEYVSANTDSGFPKYYAMKGGATGNTSSTSGSILLAPVPDSTYEYQIHFNKIPDKLEASSNETNFIIDRPFRVEVNKHKADAYNLVPWFDLSLSNTFTIYKSMIVAHADVADSIKQTYIKFAISLDKKLTELPNDDNDDIPNLIPNEPKIIH